MRPRAFLTALLSLSVLACSTAVPPAGMPTPAPTAAAPGADAVAAAAAITAESVQRHVVFLASDELLGRDTPSPGLERAAEYIADTFRELGLDPAGDNGSYIQRFPLQDSRVDMARLRVESRAHGTTTRLTFADDFFALPTPVDSVVGVPLFAGQAAPGVRVPPEVRGRIVFYFVPDTASQAWQAAVSAGLQAAYAGGASAVVIALDPDFDAPSLRQLAHELASQVVPLPVVGLRYDAARSILQHANVNLDAVRARADGTVTSLDGVTMSISTPVAASSAEVPNVVAILRGSDPALRDEYVVYSAHFDHVGVGPPDATGDSIYNGADDNASGTSAVLELARAFATLERRPARSIMFVMVSGEEKGLLGSMYFVQNPPVPASQMVANINADMIGRNAPDTVVAIGQDYSTLGPTVQRVAARHPELGLVVAPDLWPQEQLFFRSDHFAFAAREIPAIFFTTGLHEQYHQPSDQAHLIDNDKLARITRLLFHFGLEIANASARPQWTRDGLETVRRATGAGGQ
jgi:hypothetical protein